MDVSPRTEELAAQVRYGRWLAWGTRVGLGLLVVGFVVYVSGFLAPQVPIERLPQLWGRPAGEFLAATGAHPGWGWAAFLHRSDMLVLAAIALLSSWSIACLAAAMPIFAARRERVFVAICALEIAVLALAASGVLSAAH